MSDNKSLHLYYYKQGQFLVCGMIAAIDKDDIKKQLKKIGYDENLLINALEYREGDLTQVYIPISK